MEKMYFLPKKQEDYTKLKSVYELFGWIFPETFSNKEDLTQGIDIQRSLKNIPTLENKYIEEIVSINKNHEVVGGQPYNKAFLNIFFLITAIIFISFSIGASTFFLGSQLPNTSDDLIFIMGFFSGIVISVSILSFLSTLFSKYSKKKSTSKNLSQKEIEKINNIKNQIVESFNINKENIRYFNEYLEERLAYKSEYYFYINL